MAKVLVIDDSSFQRKWIVKAVQQLGHDAVEASDGQEGLNMLTSEKPDCVTVDLNMPTMNGLQFLANTSDINSDVPVIVITADIQDATRKQCQRLGARAFLNKPFRPDDIQKILKQFLNSADDQEPASDGR